VRSSHRRQRGPGSAENLADWSQWCEQQGAKLRDRSVDIHSLSREMIIPVAVKERPPYPLLALEWPWDLCTGSGTSFKVIRDGSRVMLTDAEFRVDDYSSRRPLKFSVTAAGWDVPYQAEFGPAGLHYRPANEEEADVEERRGVTVPLSAWLNGYKPTLFLAGDRMITGDDRLLELRSAVRPYPRSALRPLDWAAGGVNIRVEPQGTERRPDSIQAFMVRHLMQTQTFDVLIDDDRSGEAAASEPVKIGLLPELKASTYSFCRPVPAVPTSSPQMILPFCRAILDS
jgi:hypothetical protein